MLLLNICHKIFVKNLIIGLAIILTRFLAQHKIFFQLSHYLPQNQMKLFTVIHPLIINTLEYNRQGFGLKFQWNHIFVDDNIQEYTKEIAKVARTCGSTIMHHFPMYWKNSIMLVKKITPERGRDITVYCLWRKDVH